MLNMELLPDWKEAWRWASMRCMAVAMALQGTWVFLPDDLRERAPEEVITGMTLFILFFGFVGRIFQKKEKA